MIKLNQAAPVYPQTEFTENKEREKIDFVAEITDCISDSLAKG
ncbi:MAG: hypothetical protein K0Q87_4304, partial [Neobacillus sp.]|nr:hypothetical protein [Neobacillus sp.]